MTTTPSRWPVAILGTGNIGTDLLVKLLSGNDHLEVVAVAGIDPASAGLARARAAGVATTAEGVEGLLRLPPFEGVRAVFDATSAGAHRVNWAALEPTGVHVLDLTPAALGPYCVPVVNLEQHAEARNLNLVTCGGQATVPIVAAASSVGRVVYAEIVAAIASRSAGPGTRANIDEFVQTTARALEQVGGAERGKAIMILNPADPPMLMRDTVHCLVDGDVDATQLREAIEAQVARVQAYVPGYRLRGAPTVQRFGSDDPLHVTGYGAFVGTQVTTLLEVEGAADHLPAFAGNLDIMTAAAVATAERLATRMEVSA